MAKLANLPEKLIPTGDETVVILDGGVAKRSTPNKLLAPKRAEFDTNADARTAGFDANAVTKTAAYNNNAANVTVTFNNNVAAANAVIDGKVTLATQQADRAVAAANSLGIKLPGYPALSYSWKDGINWLYADPWRIDHPTIYQLQSKTAGIVTSQSYPGGQAFGVSSGDGIDYFRARPGRGGLQHVDTDDLKRRSYADEIATQRNPMYDVLRPSADILANPSIGQSNEVSQSAYGPSTLKPFSDGSSIAPPALGIMFNGGIRPGDLSTNMATQMASFVPMVESYCAAPALGGGACGETVHSGIVWMISQLLREENDVDLSTYTRRFLGYSVGRPGTTSADLTPPLDTFGRHALMKEGITRSLPIAQGLHKTIETGCQIVLQGEYESARPAGGADVLAWSDNWRRSRSNLEAHAQQTYGGTRPLPVIFEQIANRTNGNMSAIAYHQTALAMTDPWFVMFPSHMYARGPDTVHFTDRQAFIRGLFIGWLLKRLCWDSVKIMPFVPTVFRQGKFLICTWPDLGRHRKLTFDAVSLPLQPFYGVTVDNSAAAAQTIVDVRVVGERKLVIELSADPGANARVQFGRQGSASLSQCNLCDDTPIVGPEGRLVRRYVPICEVTAS